MFRVISIVFYLSILVDIGLLLKNRFLTRDGDIKRQINIVFLGTLIGFLPFLVLSGFPRLVFGAGSEYILVPSNISSLTLIFIPIAYGYVIYQRKLLKVDLIINRVLVLFLLILSVLLLSFCVLSVLSRLFDQPVQLVIAGSLLCVLVALPSASLQKRVQMQVDRVLYGQLL